MNAEALSKYQELYDHLDFVREPVFVSTSSNQLCFWNRAAETVYGWTRAEVIGQDPDKLFGVCLIESDAHDELPVKNGSWRGTVVRTLKCGATITVDCQRIIHRMQADTAANVLDISRDLADATRQESELRDTSRLLQAVMDNTTSYIHVRDASGKFLYANDEYERVFGVRKDDIIGKCIEEVFPADIAATRREMHETVMRSKIDIHAEITEEVEGSRRTFMDVKSPLLDDHGKVYAVYCIGTDITERKALEQRMHQLAHFDIVTGLPNRVLFHDRLGEALKKSVRTSRSMALIFLDLDGFKDINDLLGHDIGDRLLNAVGMRLCSCMRACDTVARMGGDEFTVILENVNMPTDVAPIATKILTALRRPFQIEGQDVYVTASLGITMCPQDANDAGSLLRNADHAMYSSKRSGPSNFRFYDESMNLSTAAKVRITSDIKDALRDNQFRLVYQPIVSLSDGAVYKAEALIRWEHPVKGSINPGDFISVAETSGDIVEIGDWVFREAVQQCAHWRHQYDKRFQISVNTSPIQYRGAGIDVAGWNACMDKAGVKGDAMVVEITEGLMMDATHAVKQQLVACSVAGMEIALDDFGTGYSSLSYLKKFEVDYLKIDRSFIVNLTPESDASILCEAIIAMAHKLGLRVIAEGIETTQQRNVLIAAGCDFGQGYLFSRPVAPSDFESAIRQSAAARLS